MRRGDLVFQPIKAATIKLTHYPEIRSVGLARAGARSALAGSIAAAFGHPAIGRSNGSLCHKAGLPKMTYPTFGAGSYTALISNQLFRVPLSNWRWGMQSFDRHKFDPT